MKTQIEITQWEIQNRGQYTSWEITYGKEFDVIVFKKEKEIIKEFKRIK
jgi:hypothetical protein